MSRTERACLVLTRRIPDRPRQPEMQKFIRRRGALELVVARDRRAGLTPIRGNMEGRIAGAHSVEFLDAAAKVAEGRGGHFSKNSNISPPAMELAAHPEVTYLVAFNPAPRDGKFHTLRSASNPSGRMPCNSGPAYSPAEPKIEPLRERLWTMPFFPKRFE